MTTFSQAWVIRQWDWLSRSMLRIGEEWRGKLCRGWRLGVWAWSWPFVGVPPEERRHGAGGMMDHFREQTGNVEVVEARGFWGLRMSQFVIQYFEATVKMPCVGLISNIEYSQLSSSFNYDRLCKGEVLVSQNLTPVPAIAPMTVSSRQRICSISKLPTLLLAYSFIFTSCLDLTPGTCISHSLTQSLEAVQIAVPVIFQAIPTIRLPFPFSLRFLFPFPFPFRLPQLLLIPPPREFISITERLLLKESPSQADSLCWLQDVFGFGSFWFSNRRDLRDADLDIEEGFQYLGLECIIIRGNGKLAINLYRLIFILNSCLEAIQATLFKCMGASQTQHYNYLKLKMNPICLENNHNPKNQLSFLPCKQEEANSDSTEPKVKLEEAQEQSHSENEQKDVTFYEEEVKKLAYMNAVITAQLSSAIEEKKIIMRLISEAERREENVEESERQKRVRRCAKDIERKFQCQEKECGKSYGTESSLLQHIRLKHPQTNSHDPPLMQGRLKTTT